MTSPARWPQRLLLAAAALALAAAAAPERAIFVDATRATGLDFVHFNGMSGERYMPENMGGGGALVDYDGDGDLDLYLVQGRMLPAEAPVARATVAPRHPLPLTDRLYRNELTETGRLAFTDVTAQAGLPPACYGMGAATGDYDGDGDPDLYVTCFGANRLLRNDGGGRFTDVTRAAGAGDERWSVPAVFFDYDGDGRLDLYVGNYLDFTFARHRPCTTKAGGRDYCDPQVYPGVPDRLLRNRGDGTFEDVTAAARLGKPGKALGALAFDADGDGRLDLYVANDGEANHLWLQRERGRFADEALLAGVAVDGAGRAEASMGIDAGDADGDGDLDLFLSHFTGETNTLYSAEGAGTYRDATERSGLGPPSLEATGFGARFLDYDNDGDLDLLVVNGAVRALERGLAAGESYPYRQRDQLFENVGRGRYQDVSRRAGRAFAHQGVSRGALFGDLDDDGDTDVVVVDNAAAARVLLNQVGQGRPWIGLRLLARGAGRHIDAQGARVVLERKGAAPLVRRAGTDGSYAAAGDPRVVFGLGAAAKSHPAERVVVYWPDGRAEAFAAPPAGRYTTLRQGSGGAVR